MIHWSRWPADVTLRQTVTLRGSVQFVDNLAEAPEASGLVTLNYGVRGPREYYTHSWLKHLKLIF